MFRIFRGNMLHHLQGISVHLRRYFPPKRRKTTHQSTGCNITGDLNLQQHRRENLRLHIPYINKIHKAENFVLHHQTNRTLCRVCIHLVAPKLPDCYSRYGQSKQQIHSASRQAHRKPIWLWAQNLMPFSCNDLCFTATNSLARATMQ